jgi:adenosylmethionine-8-amino-7-oxononanoate aminotransferase
MVPSAVTELGLEDQLVAKALSNGVNLTNGHVPMRNGSSQRNGLKRTEFLLDRHLRKDFPIVVSGKGNYLYLKDGRAVFDATSGAAVSCLGHDNKRVIKAVNDQMNTGIPYLASTFWGYDLVEALCKELVDGTGGNMTRVYLTGSGSSHKLVDVVET